MTSDRKWLISKYFVLVILAVVLVIPFLELQFDFQCP